MDEIKRDIYLGKKFSKHLNLGCTKIRGGSNKLLRIENIHVFRFLIRYRIFAILSKYRCNPTFNTTFLKLYLGESIGNFIVHMKSIFSFLES